MSPKRAAGVPFDPPGEPTRGVQFSRAAWIDPEEELPLAREELASEQRRQAAAAELQRVREQLAALVRHPEPAAPADPFLARYRTAWINCRDRQEGDPPTQTDVAIEMGYTGRSGLTKALKTRGLIWGHPPTE